MNCWSQAKIWRSEHLAAEVREEEMQVGFFSLQEVKYCDIRQDG